MPARGAVVTVNTQPSLTQSYERGDPETPFDLSYEEATDRGFEPT